MLQKNRSFPSWAGPFVGAIVGAGLAFKAARREGGGLSWEWVVAGAAMGFLAGGIVWILDRPLSDSVLEDDDLEPFEDDEVPLVDAVSSSLIGRFLALLCVLFCLVPMVGLTVGVPAVVVNYRTTDWTRPTSLICSIISLLTTLMMIALLLVVRPS
jgi:hypothetical protein